MECRNPLNTPARILQLGKELKEAVDLFGDDCESSWHSVVLIAVAGELLYNCKELISSEEERNIYRAAWATRNLLELHYWVRFISASKQNARRFHEDIICDFNDLIARLARESLAPEHVAAGKGALTGMLQHLSEIDLDDRFLSVAEIAKSFSDEKYFSVVNKFLSKFVHPTSTSIHLRLAPMLTDPLVLGIRDTALQIIEKTFPVLAKALIELHRQVASSI
jgi:hypothetical protein